MTLRADVNYPTLRNVLRDIGLCLDAGKRVEAAGPLDGDRIDIGTHTDFAGLNDATLAAIGRARQAGFKGQSAPCIILAEIDFDAFDEWVARRLYVGAKQARMSLSLVTSERVAAHLMDRLGQGSRRTPRGTQAPNLCAKRRQLRQFLVAARPRMAW